MNRYEAFGDAPDSRVDPQGLSPHIDKPAEQVRIINGTKVPIVVQGDDPGSADGEYWDVLCPTESSAKNVDTDYVWYKSTWWKISPNVRDVAVTKTGLGAQEPSLFVFTGEPNFLTELRRDAPVDKDVTDRTGRPTWYPGSPNSGIRLPQWVVEKYRKAGGDDWFQLEDSVKPQTTTPPPGPQAKDPFNFPPDLSPGARQALRDALAREQAGSAPTAAPSTRPTTQPSS
jgi:hypothetical protein